MQGRNTVCLPVRRDPSEPARFVTLDILNRFEFDADHMMSGVIAREARAVSGQEEEEAEVFLKGSPHAVIQLVAHNRLPDNWAPVSFCTFCMLCMLCTLLIPCHAVIQLVAHNRLPDNWAPVSFCTLCMLCTLRSPCQRTLSSSWWLTIACLRNKPWSVSARFACSACFVRLHISVLLSMHHVILTLCVSN